MNKILVVCLIYFGTVEGFDWIGEDYEDYYYENIHLRNALMAESNFRKGGKICGDLVCVEKAEEIVPNGDLMMIPNARNITCVICVNRITRKPAPGPVTQQREVVVFEKITDTCYRPTNTRIVNDGCKCSHETI